VTHHLTLPLASAVLLGSACVPAGPLSANGVSFWEITTSAVSYQGCSDSRAFHDAVPHWDVEGAFLVYRVSPDGTSAVQQACDRVDAASCLAATDGLTWTIDGATLRTVQEVRDALDASGCQLVQQQRWAMTPVQAEIQIIVTSTLSLVGAASACDPIQAAVQARAPNGQGLDGCVVTYRLAGELR
jgi:hypothetical protein